MSKVNFRRELRHLYQPKREFVVVDVPSMQFLMIDGHGDPNVAPEYQEAVEALYAVSYRVKFASKNELDRDYAVPPLEGLWWAADMEMFTANRDKSAWDWTMMIMQPQWIKGEIVQRAIEQVSKRKPLSNLDALRLETYHEGLSVQILHVGSYDDEAPTIHRMHHEFMPAHGYEPAGKHHEIYLSDPRRTPPEKLKTVLRQPVRKAGVSCK
jgi:hypothetical protein